jgi:hypothetical protein
MDLKLGRSMEEFVEELRSTGYHGRDRSVADAPAHVGTRVTALRQMELIASQIASAWLDGDMDDGELRQFVAVSFDSKMDSLANIVDSTFPAAPAHTNELLASKAQEKASSLDGACRRGVRLIRSLRSDAGADDAWPVSLLIAAMVLRQAAERDLLQTSKDEKFCGNSTNVAPEFFKRCVDKVGERLFGAVVGMPLSELESKLVSENSEPQKAFDPPTSRARSA